MNKVTIAYPAARITAETITAADIDRIGVQRAADIIGAPIARAYHPLFRAVYFVAPAESPERMLIGEPFGAELRDVVDVAEEWVLRKPEAEARPPATSLAEVAEEWIRRDNAFGGRRELGRVYVGIKGVGPVLSWDYRRGGWSNLYSRGNCGRNWSHGGNWSAADTAAPTICEAIASRDYIAGGIEQSANRRREAGYADIFLRLAAHELKANRGTK